MIGAAGAFTMARGRSLGQHRAVLRLPGSPFLSAVAAALVLHVMVLAAPATAQEPEAALETEATQEAEGRTRSTATPPSAGPVRWEPGPMPELWAAPAIGLGVGGLTLALAVVLGQVATANHREATDPATTQLRASQLAPTVPELSLAANILFAVGGGMALIGATWLVVLPFSHHPVTASVRASIGPGGLTLSGTF